VWIAKRDNGVRECCEVLSPFTRLFLPLFGLVTTAVACEPEEALFELPVLLLTLPLEQVEGFRFLLEFDGAIEMRGKPAQLPPAPVDGTGDP